MHNNILYKPTCPRLISHCLYYNKCVLSVVRSVITCDDVGSVSAAAEIGTNK